MQIQGEITHVTPLEYVGNNQLEKRTIRVLMSKSDDGQYENAIMVDLLKDNATKVTETDIGKSIELSLNFSTNYSENTQKHYNSVRGWKVKVLEDLPESSEEDLPF